MLEVSFHVQKAVARMSTQFPDHETICAALSLATRAPSVHNTQPWRWQVNTDRLHLYAERGLQLPTTDPDARDLIISCGISLHHCVAALAALGWQSRVHRHPDLDDPEHLAAVEVYRQPPTEVDVTLAAAIPRRRTDRRPYSSWNVPTGYIAQMGARAMRAGVMLRQVESLPRLQEIVAQAARQHASSYDYLKELTTWSGRYASVAGVPARNTPPARLADQVSQRIFAGPALTKSPAATALDDNAVVLALGTRYDGVVPRLRAGEATSLVLLSATALGLATCPITEPLEIAETRALVRTEVFGENGYPQMLMRVGWAPVDADPLPATPRRSLPDAVTCADGSAFVP
jgi:nitroreductase